jgi:hypothetical protein
VNEHLGTELSEAARQVIADARGGDDPSAEDQARVKARWLAGIAAGAGVSSLSEAVRAAASTGWGLKAGALVAAFVAATAGIYLGWPQPSEAPGDARERAVASTPASKPAASAAPALPAAPAEPARVTQVPAAVPPAAVPPAAVPPAAVPSEAVPPEASAPAVQPEVAGEARQAAPQGLPGVAPETAQAVPATPEVRSSVPARSAAAARRAASAQRASSARVAPARAAVQPGTQPDGAAAAASPSGQLGEEISLLSEIRGNLQAGAASRALNQLADYRRRFGQPNLAMEADALQVDALCGSGQREAARAAATAFASNWPGSPLQQRVSAACR